MLLPETMKGIGKFEKINQEVGHPLPENVDNHEQRYLPGKDRLDTVLQTAVIPLYGQ